MYIIIIINNITTKILNFSVNLIWYLVPQNLASQTIILTVFYNRWNNRH